MAAWRRRARRSTGSPPTCASTRPARARTAPLDRLAGAVPPGSDGVLCLPYFLGEKTPVQDPLARGTFTGLSLSHTPAHLWRALLEAIAFGFRHHVEVLDEIGYAPRRFLASDGGSRSRVWMQIVADVLQAPVRLHRERPWLGGRRRLRRRGRLGRRRRLGRRGPPRAARAMRSFRSRRTPPSTTAAIASIARFTRRCGRSFGCAPRASRGRTCAPPPRP